MKQCWNHHGLTEHGAEIAEGAIEDMCRLLEKCEDKGGVAEMVLREAIFRRVYLPQRAKEFRDRYFEINGKPHPREELVAAAAEAVEVFGDDELEDSLLCRTCGHPKKIHFTEVHRLTSNCRKFE